MSERRHQPVFPGFREMSERRQALSDELVERRRALGLSQTQVAARMGTSSRRWPGSRPGPPTSSCPRSTATPPPWDGGSNGRSSIPGREAPGEPARVDPGRPAGRTAVRPQEWMRRRLFERGSYPGGSPRRRRGHRGRGCADDPRRRRRRDRRAADRLPRGLDGRPWPSWTSSTCSGSRSRVVHRPGGRSPGRGPGRLSPTHHVAPRPAPPGRTEGEFEGARGCWQELAEAHAAQWATFLPGWPTPPAGPPPRSARTPPGAATWLLSKPWPTASSTRWPLRMPRGAAPAPARRIPAGLTPPVGRTPPGFRARPGPGPSRSRGWRWTG